MAGLKTAVVFIVVDLMVRFCNFCTEYLLLA